MQQILPNSSSIAILFVANVGYYKSCYHAFRELYTNIKGVGFDSIQIIDINNLAEKRLKGKVQCCMPKSAKSTQSGYVLSSGANILADAIKAIITG